MKIESPQLQFSLFYWNCSPELTFLLLLRPISPQLQTFALWEDFPFLLYSPVPFKQYHLEGVHVRAQSFQSCLTLRDPMDCSLAASSTNGILQARILEWIAIPSSRGSSPPRDRTPVHCLLHHRQILNHCGSPLRRRDYRKDWKVIMTLPSALSPCQLVIPSNKRDCLLLLQLAHAYGFDYSN